MKVFLGVLIVFLGFIYYQLFVFHPEIQWRAKVVNFAMKGMHMINRVGTKDFARRIPRPYLRHTNGEYIDNVLIQEMTIPHHKNASHHVKLLVLIPKEIKTNTIQLNIHGGGFVFHGNKEIPVAFAKTGMIVVYVDYSLSPESKFPLAFEECVSTYLWMLKKDTSFLKNMEKIIVFGDSAGANLAIGLSYYVRENDLKMVDQQILLYPPVCFDWDRSKADDARYHYLLHPKTAHWFSEQYIHDEKEYENPFLCALKAKDHFNLPPSLILVAKYDILRNPGVHYAQVLQEHNNTVTLKEYDEIHGFFLLFGMGHDAFVYVTEYIKNKALF